MKLLTRLMPPVEFSTEEVGTAIANAGDYEQREVLIAMANAVDKMAWNNGSWPDQCRAIVEGCRGTGLAQHDRIRISSMLGCLIDHLNEPVRETT
tara:strand:- start:134 stop:418 length:285 start_codon:yes stop_codon:yes gene_type:complete